MVGSVLTPPPGPAVTKQQLIVCLGLKAIDPVHRWAQEAREHPIVASLSSCSYPGTGELFLWKARTNLWNKEGIILGFAGHMASRDLLVRKQHRQYLNE